MVREMNHFSVCMVFFFFLMCPFSTLTPSSQTPIGYLAIQFSSNVIYIEFSVRSHKFKGSPTGQSIHQLQVES